MSILSSIIGGGTAVIGSLASAHAARKAQKALNEMEKKNEQWYERRYNEDATQRADVQRILTAASDALMRNGRAATAQAAITGGSQEAAATQKAANSNAFANIMAEAASKAEDRKDYIEDEYLSRKDNIQNKIIRNKEKKAENISKAVKGLGNIFDFL